MHLFLLLFGHAAADCMEVVCTAHLEDGVCYKPDHPANKIYVQECGQGQVCAANQMYSGKLLKIYEGTQYCVDENYTTGKVDGESCTTNLECATQVCAGSRCKGLSVGAACKSPDECQVGFTCSSLYNTCTPVAQEGEPCVASSDCANNSDCLIDRCVKYFSVPVAVFVQNSTPLICETGYSLDGYCRPAPKNENSPGTQCFSSSDCPLKGTSRTASCGCGLNLDGDAYCTAAPGDDEFVDFKRTFLKLLEINENCHTSISISGRCHDLEKTPELADFIKAYYLYVYRYLVIEAPNCVIRAITPFAAGYSPADDDSSSSSSSDSVSVSFVTVVTLSVVIPAMLILGIIFIIVIRKLKTVQVAPHSDERVVHRVVMHHSRLLQHEEGTHEVLYRIEDLISCKYRHKKGIPIANAVDLESREDEDNYTDEDVAYFEEEESIEVSKDISSEMLFEPRSSR